MSRITRKNLSWALVVVFVFACVLVPAAGARTGIVRRTIQPDWTCLGGAPCVMSPWYARDAAVRNMQQQRHEQSVHSQRNGIYPGPSYVYDPALSRLVPTVHKVRNVQHQRSHRAAYRSITDTLGGNGGA